MSKIDVLLLFIVSTLVVACSRSSAEDTHGARVADAEGGTVLVRGTFDGLNDHVVSGGIEVVERGGALFVVLGADFFLDGAPDPKVGFGRNGTYDESTTFTPLGANTGAQTYALPVGLELSGYDEAYIWCEEFSVALGVAALE